MDSAMLCGPRVLAVQLGDVDLLGRLGLVRMIGAAIDAEVAHLDATERTTRDHAFDGLLEHALGMLALEDLARGALLDVADVTGVLVIGLLLALAAGENRILRVDDDDVVAAINVRGVGREVLAAQAHGDDGGETADDQTLGVDQYPLLRHLSRLCRKGFHVRVSVNGEHRREHRTGLADFLGTEAPRSMPKGGIYLFNINDLEIWY